MPQPLNRVVPEVPNINYGGIPVDDNAARAVCSIFSGWAYIEHQLSVVLTRLLGAEATPAYAIFSILQAQHLQEKALEAAAKSVLSSDDFDIFQAALSIVDSAAADRNRLAHWVWGKCKELPDALLLLDPEHLKEQDRQRTMASAQRLDNQKSPEEWMRLFRLDHSQILVYRQGDLDRAIAAIKDANTVLFYLHEFLSPMFKEDWRQFMGEPDEVGTREFARRELLRTQSFREALNRIRASQQKPPLLPPEPRKPKPRR